MCNKLDNTICYDSRLSDSKNYRKRYRRCLKCKHLMVTLEIIIPKKPKGCQTEASKKIYREELFNYLYDVIQGLEE